MGLGDSEQQEPVASLLHPLCLQSAQHGGQPGPGLLTLCADHLGILRKWLSGSGVKRDLGVEEDVVFLAMVQAMPTPLVQEPPLEQRMSSTRAGPVLFMGNP